MSLLAPPPSSLEQESVDSVPEKTKKAMRKPRVHLHSCVFSFIEDSKDRIHADALTVVPLILFISQHQIAVSKKTIAGLGRGSEVRATPPHTHTHAHTRI